MKVIGKQRVRFESLREYVKFFGLENRINTIANSETGYGKWFEERLYTLLRRSGAYIKKAGTVLDLIKGVDYIYYNGENELLIDVKLNMVKATRGNLFYFNDALELTRTSEEMFMYPLSYDIEVGFALRNIRSSADGYCIFDKPVLVAVFNMTTDIAPHSALTPDAIKQFNRYLECINYTMVREGYPAKDGTSFDFKFHDKNARSLG